MTTSLRDPGRIFGRGISFPPRVGATGRTAWSSGAENVRESIRVILATEPGERLMLADFGAGLTEFLFQPNTVATRRLIEDRVRQSLERWEPRISMHSVRVEASATDPRSASVTIEYTLVADQSPDRVELTLDFNS